MTALSVKAADPGAAIGLGAGFPELCHISGRVGITSALQTGLRFFMYNSGDKDMRAVTFDIQYHWNKHVKEIGDRAPWFFSLGVTFLVDDDEKRRFEDTYLLMGLGWEQKLRNNLGWQIDGGIGTLIQHDRELKKFYLDLNLDSFAVIPYLRVQIFSYF